MKKDDKYSALSLAKVIALGGGCLLMLMFLNSCKKTGSGKNPEDMIKQLVKEKYNISVEVNNLEEKSGSFALDESYYQGTASVENTGEEFDVYLGKKTGVLSDDYPKLIYDDQIRAFADQEINNCQNMDIASYEIIYRPSDGKWVLEDGCDVMDYLSESDTEIEFVVQMDSISQQNAKDIYSFARSLEEKGVQFTLKIETSKNSYYVSSNKRVKLKSEDEVIDMLTRE